MLRFSIDELHCELEATDEGYVRRKLAIGGYTSVQAKHVRTWLAQRDADRAMAVSRRTAFWTMIGAVGGLGAFLATIAAMLATKAG